MRRPIHPLLLPLLATGLAIGCWLTTGAVSFVLMAAILPVLGLDLYQEGVHRGERAAASRRLRRAVSTAPVAPYDDGPLLAELAAADPPAPVPPPLRIDLPVSAFHGVPGAWPIKVWLGGELQGNVSATFVRSIDRQVYVLQLEWGSGRGTRVSGSRARRARVLAGDNGSVDLVTAGPRLGSPMGKYGAALPEPTAGVHEWTAIALYRVSDPEAATKHLDLENLISITIACLHCERPYSPTLAAAPCTAAGA